MSRPLPDKNNEHYKKYAEIAEKLGIESLKDLIPVASDKIFTAYQEDQHLNNIPLQRWDSQDVFVRFLARDAGFKSWSLSTTVCLLKHVAIFHYMKGD